MMWCATLTLFLCCLAIPSSCNIYSSKQPSSRLPARSASRHRSHWLAPLPSQTFTDACTAGTCTIRSSRLVTRNEHVFIYDLWPHFLCTIRINTLMHSGTSDFFVRLAVLNLGSGLNEHVQLGH
ncbi:hypothetical protein DENSPDRAFT_832481 [Dentipellis sp. KUC8613]|nr:hypothetical protein DENSPDRAFT_832481 [Dentipellis sp. KUC8613]